MRDLMLAVTVVVATAGATSERQTSTSNTSDDEAAIRRLLEQSEGPGGRPLPQTDDQIWWGAPYERPIILGRGQPTEIASDVQPSKRTPGSQQSKLRIIRIEVAEAGDLAYEFSDNEISYELKNGRRNTVLNSVLRVWKKVDGQWKVAAHLARAHHVEGSR